MSNRQISKARLNNRNKETTDTIIFVALTVICGLWINFFHNGHGHINGTAADCSTALLK